MINAEDRHIEIIKNILSKYLYTFYALDSRTRYDAKRLSDLDLCFFENIPWNIRAHIEEDFEESNLPYKVDLVDWQNCDKAFRDLIEDDLICLQASPDLLTVEQNMFEYFKYGPTLPGFRVMTDAQGVTINNDSIVSEIPLTESNVESVINKVIEEYSNGQNFSWWIGPSTQPKNIGKILQNRGFAREKCLAMISHLDEIPTQNPETILDIKLAESPQDLQDTAKEYCDMISNPFYAQF